jgi:hypothetical protein
MNALWTGGGAALSIVAGCAGGVNDVVDLGDVDASEVADAGEAGAVPWTQPDAGNPGSSADASLPANGADSAPSGGGEGDGQAPASACTGKTLAVTTSNLFIADFESGALQGWYDYQATGALNALVVGSPGAVNTAHAGHLAAGGLTTFGGGMGFQTVCWDTSALDGVSFWAKGTAGSDNRFQFQVAIPATHAVADGGDCVAKCFDHPSKQLVFTPDWTQYVVPFSALAQAGWGTPATYSGVIMALNWVSVDASSVDFWVDEIAFYKGTASVGPVGAGAPPVDAGQTD